MSYSVNPFTGKFDRYTKSIFSLSDFPTSPGDDKFLKWDDALKELVWANFIENLTVGTLKVTKEVTYKADIAIYFDGE